MSALPTFNEHTPLCLDAIPAKLKALSQWFCWKLEQRDGKPTKVPYDAKTGRRGKSNDPTTWCDFETALAAFQRGGYSGIGFAFQAGDGLCGLDLDHVIDLITGVVDPCALEILERFKGTYCEVSPSGTGYRIFAYGTPGRAGKNEGRHKWLEVYDHTSPRYLTVTGHHWQGTATAVTEQQEALNWLHPAYFTPPVPAVTPTATRLGPALSLDDTALLDKAMAAANGAKFRALWGGGTADYGGDESTADFALCLLLAFWTGKDADRINRLFRQSGLMREKWEREDYRQRTIDKAIAGCTEVYTGVGQRVEATPVGKTPIAADHWPRLTPDDKPPHLTTDQANGYRLARDIGCDLLYVTNAGWYAYTGTHWQRSEEFAYRKVQVLSRLILAESAAIAHTAAGTDDSDKRKKLTGIVEALTQWAQKSESRDKLYAAMTLARPMLAIDHGALDKDNWLLACENGTLDLRTGCLRQSRRDDFITRCLPLGYDPSAACPTWLAFLDRLFAGNQSVIRFVQKSVGYSLTGDTSEQCVFFLHGTGQNGKSTLLVMLQSMVGAYAHQAAPDLLLASQHNRHPTELAELRGARLVSAVETGDGRRLNENLVKQMSGGDRMKGRFMRQDFLEFQPTHKIWLATNHKPVIRGTDYAIWRRIRLIPFAVTIPPEERDPKLPEKLRAELPGVLAWAVRGCLAWQQEGLEPPQEVVEATDAYRADMDTLKVFFDECCVIDRCARAKASELYNTYKSWCEQTGERAENQRSFGMRLSERGLERVKITGVVWWRGLGLVDDVDQCRPTFDISAIESASRKTYTEDRLLSSTWSTNTPVEYEEGTL